jgi:hypothetical protein
VSWPGFNDTWWLENFLTLLLELVKLRLSILVRFVILLQMIHHFFHWETLAFREGVLSKQVEVLFFFLLEEMPLED